MPIWGPTGANEIQWDIRGEWLLAPSFKRTSNLKLLVHSAVMSKNLPKNKATEGRPKLRDKKLSTGDTAWARNQPYSDFQEPKVPFSASESMFGDFRHSKQSLNQSNHWRNCVRHKLALLAWSVCRREKKAWALEWFTQDSIMTHLKRLGHTSWQDLLTGRQGVFPPPFLDIPGLDSDHIPQSA